MREILTALNLEAGTTGSMVITLDGIMVAAALGEHHEEDSMAAFAASLLLTVKKSLSALNASSGFRSVTLSATHGKLSFFDMSNSYLMLVSDPNTELDCEAAPIQKAINKIVSRRMV